MYAIHYDVHKMYTSMHIDAQM